MADSIRFLLFLLFYMNTLRIEWFTVQIIAQFSFLFHMCLWAEWSRQSLPATPEVSLEVGRACRRLLPRSFRSLQNAPLWCDPRTICLVKSSQMRHSELKSCDCLEPHVRLRYADIHMTTFLKNDHASFRCCHRDRKFPAFFISDVNWFRNSQQQSADK